MNSMSLLLATSTVSASVSWWDVGTALLASFGGIVVFWGLWLEKKYEKEAYTNVDDFRFCKSKRERGWKILMLGISLEIVIGFAHALEDGIEIKRIESDTVKNAPLNQPVSDISAKVVVKLEGTNFARVNDMFDLRKDNWVMFCSTKTNEAVFDSGSLKSLMAEDVLPFVHYRTPNEAVISHGYVIKYIENSLNFFESKTPPQESRPIAKEVLEKVKVLRILPGFIPKETKVIGGEVWLTINGNLRTKFIIYPQEMDKTFLEWNPDFKTLVFLATNSIP
jgi:hypothetical protein